MDKELVKKFRKLAIKHREVIQNYLSKFNIYVGQHRIFFRLEENPNITLTELSEVLNVSKESLSVSLKRLDQGGYINKSKDKNDKRRYLLSLSDKGLETSQACRVGFDDINEALFKNLDEVEKDQLLILFDKMIDGLEGDNV